MKKLEKNGEKTGLIIQRKIGKSGKTRSKKEKKRKNTGKRKIFLHENACLSVPISTNFGQRTSLVPGIILGFCPRCSMNF